MVFIWVLLPVLCMGQDNLVPNGNFEQHNSCPNSAGDYIALEDWNLGLGSPDYFHKCGTGGGGVPNNVTGRQLTIDSAYLGLASFTTFFQGGQEVAGVTLSAPLIQGEKYRVRLKASYADSANYAICCIGAILSSTPPPAGPYTQNLSSVELVLQENEFDTVTWFQLDEVYTAQGGEDKIYIGSFRPEADMNPILVRPNGSSNYNSAYFYIDDVEVYEDAVTGIEKTESEAMTVSVYPNPATSNLTIQSKTPLAQVWLMDAVGRVLRYTTLVRGTQDDHAVDISALPTGIYFLELTNQEGRKAVRKFIKE